MGFFDFFKRKDKSKQEELTKPHDEFLPIILKSISMLENNGSTISDVKKYLTESGYNEQQTNLIAERAAYTYQKVLASKNEDVNLFDNILKYREHIISFLGMQQHGNYAPIAAYDKPDGEIVGFLYLIGKDDSYSLSAIEAVVKMEHNFAQKLKDNAIESYVILYHSAFNYDDNHAPTNIVQDFKAVSVAYHFKNGMPGEFGICYKFDEEGPVYELIQNFTQEQNQRIFNTQLQAGKDYFQEKEEIVSPVLENSIGLKIKKSNNRNVSDIWAAIFGFETYRNSDERSRLIELTAFAKFRGDVNSWNHIKTYQVNFGKDVSYKAIYTSDSPKTIVPVINTDYWVDVENKEINEWENVDSVVAIISGNGRDTFGVSYLATDYAKNREIYLSQKKLNIKISGIVFVLDLHQKEKWNEKDIELSDDFTGYMPGQGPPNYACFDFVGEIESLKEIYILEGNTLKAYMMKVRLITHPEISDFFTIDMYVTPENMRFKKITKGMRITGMVQMQGQIIK